MAAVRPDLTHEQARVLLGAGADDQGGNQLRDTPGYDIYYGWGRLNAYNSLVLATTRIDRFERNRDGTVELSWVSPPNAVSKRPYAVEASPSVTGPWTAVGGKLAYEYKRTVTEEGLSSGIVSRGVDQRAARSRAALFPGPHQAQRVAGCAQLHSTTSPGPLAD